MQIIQSKLCRFVTHYPAIGATGIILTLFAIAQLARAADGDLDPTFGTGGTVMTDINRSTDLANAVAVQSDGKLVVVGQTYKNNDYTGEDFVVTRYNTDGTLDSTFGGSNGESSADDFLLARLSRRGSLDATFGVGGKVRTSFGDLNGGANGAALQSDGKIVAAGFQATSTNQLSNFALARYLGPN